jgi:IS4 transposase
MSAAQLCALYRLRWQIELSFKRDKSIAGLDRLANFREDTCASWLTIKLLLIQLSRAIARGRARRENALRTAIEPREIFTRAA